MEKPEGDGSQHWVAVSSALLWLKGWWSQLALSRQSVVTAPTATNGKAAGVWDAPNLGAILSFLPAELRLASRVVNHAWEVAAEHGPARAAWEEHLPNFASIQGSFASEFCRRTLVRSKKIDAIFRRGVSERASVPARSVLGTQMLTFTDSVALVEDHAASFGDDPDIHLAIYDAITCTQAGTVALDSVPHAKELKRPTPLHTMRAAAQETACVLALERLVVVVSWRPVGLADRPGLRIADPNALEVWFGGTAPRAEKGGAKVLRAASFTGNSTMTVAVLFEQRKETTVEVYRLARNKGAKGEYALVQTATQGAPTAGIQATLHGNFMVWAKQGQNSIDVLSVPVPENIEEEILPTQESSEVSKALQDEVQLFGRAKLAAKTIKINVGPDGSGLDLEATRWGYLVEEVEDDPGQPDLAVGDVITAIGGQALHGLADEATLHWRFGRNFRDGAEIVVLPANVAKMLIDPEKREKEEEQKQEEAAEAKDGAEAKKEGPPVKFHLQFKGGMEAYCVDTTVTPNRLIAVADNCVWVGALDIEMGSCRAARAINGVLKKPAKNPAVAVARLGPESDIILVAAGNAVVFWKLPLLLLKTQGGEADPEMLSILEMPQHSTALCGAAGGLSTIGGPLGWAAGQLGGDSVIDLWQFVGLGAVPAGYRFAQRKISRGVVSEFGEQDEVFHVQIRSRAAFDEVSAGVCKVLKAVGAPAPSTERMGPCTVLPSSVSPANIRDWAQSAKSKLGEAGLAAEELYSLAEKAEGTLVESVRLLRHWKRQNPKATPERADHAAEVLRWVEECRRCVVWPLQAAFEGIAEGEASDESVD